MTCILSAIGGVIDRAQEDGLVGLDVQFQPVVGADMGGSYCVCYTFSL